MSAEQTGGSVEPSVPEGVSVEPSSDQDKATATNEPDATPIDELFSIDRTQFKDEQVRDVVDRHITHVVGADEITKRFNVIVLYDDLSLDRTDANKIYRAVTQADKGKKNLLVLRSPGGDIAAAYFIGKLCREFTNVGFEVAVPREAKSAATLICCGADRIHMGGLSELGPIDPQFGGMPALAVKHSLEHLAELVTQYPAAKEMLSDYLSKSLPVNVLGYFERAAGSAVQYAERLLSKRVGVLGSAAGNPELARRLVYEYKDHGFAIDAREAKSIFGDAVVVSDSAEYRLANTIYEALDFVDFLVDRMFERKFSYTGLVGRGCALMPKKKK